MKRRRPLWRLFWCLLLGGLAWWLTYRWLEPKPLWERPPTERGTVYWPLCEDRAGKVLLAWEEDASGNTKGQGSLVMLDQHTGAVLHATPHTGEELYGGDYYPRLVGQHAWRVKEYDNHDSMELRRWDPAGPERVVHQWKGSHHLSIHAQWSFNCQRLLLRFYFDYITLCQGFDNTGLLRGGLECLQRKQPVYLAWYESWHIPTAASEPPRLLARWTPHYSRWLELPHLNDDGTLAAFSDAYAHRSEVQSLLGKTTSLRGNDIPNIMRRQPHGSLIYEVATGKLVQQLNTEDTIHHQSIWFGPMLMVQGSRIMPSTTVTRDQLFARYSETDAQPRLFEDHNLCWLYGAEGWRAFEVPREPISIDLRFATINGVWMGLVNRDEVYVLERERDRWQVHHATTRRLPYDGLTSVWSVPGTKQIVYRSPGLPTLLDELHEWAIGKDWLEPWLPKPAPMRLAHTLHDLNTHTEHRLPGYCCSLEKPYLKHLYLMSETFDEKQTARYHTLRCYAMPMVFRSPWWGRGVGLCVAVLFWILLSRRAHRVTA